MGYRSEIPSDALALVLLLLLIQAHQRTDLFAVEKERDMKKTLMAVTVLLAVGFAGYALAQSAGPGMQGGMMGPGQGHGMRMMQSGMANAEMPQMMQGQALTPEQLEQFATQHGITVEQAKQMTDTCAQVMGQRNATPTPAQ
jgi:hypothetical protein